MELEGAVTGLRAVHVITGTWTDAMECLQMPAKNTTDNRES